MIFDPVDDSLIYPHYILLLLMLYGRHLSMYLHIWRQKGTTFFGEISSGEKQ